MKAQWILVLTLLFALITAVFAVINVEPVRVNFLFTETQIPLILVILGSTLLGGLIVLFFGMFREFKLNRKVKQLEKALSEQKKPTENAQAQDVVPSATAGDQLQLRAEERRRRGQGMSHNAATKGCF
ncbi:lipopolysaccharide assembly protein LapA domain-containing protein [Paenibacillus sp. P26]|nr:lipopolysaccharide assembly protein LapA domain-containing protein [Paenibacillus sp. P26]